MGGSRTTAGRHRRFGVMAIVNATPDSFSDGGRWLGEKGRNELRTQVQRWLEAGVEFIDVGAESTRPGAPEVGPEEEWQRLEAILPPLLAAANPQVLSVDTRRAEVARRALELGVGWINDVSGLADPEMAEVIAAHSAGVFIGHLRGQPATMQAQIDFEDVVGEVCDELQTAVDRALAAGIDPEGIAVDPGLGFGKTSQQCLQLLVAGSAIQNKVGFPVLIGASRKRFLGEITGAPVDQRDFVSVAAAILALQKGATWVRVHEVQGTLDALSLLREAGAIEC